MPPPASSPPPIGIPMRLPAELRIRARVALRRRIPGARSLQRALLRQDLRGLTRLEPFSSVFGLDRGTPVDRWYIELHLAAHSADIRGSVAEIGDDHYVRRFGREVSETAIVDVDPANRRATVIADLESGEGVPRSAYDCLILTQVLMLTYDVAAAVHNARLALRPGGVLLGSVSGIAQISELDERRTGEYWRFTASSVERLLREAFPPESVSVRTFGNVVTATAFLHGLAAEELTAEQLGYADPRYPLVVTFRAEAPNASPADA